MKKALFTLLLSLCFLSLYGQQTQYTIGILVDEDSQELAGIRQQLEAQIVAVVGEDAIIKFPKNSFLVNELNLEKAKENYNTLLNNDTDIILAFGALNNIVINEQKTYPKPTILFGAVNKDFVSIDDTQKTSQQPNFTYIITSQSYTKDLKVLKELTNFKNVGIIVKKQFTEMVAIDQKFSGISAELGTQYTLIPYETIGDINANLNGIDAVYLADGFLLTDAEIKSLAQTFIEKKLPAFTNTSRKDVENGLFATNQSANTIDQLFRRIALNVEATINGTNLSEVPIYIDYTSRLTVNYNTAELVDVPIKYSLIGNTDFVGDFENVLAEKKYTILSAINQALDNNLSLNATKKDVALTEQDVKLSKSNYLPSLSAAANATYVDPDLADVSFGQSPEFSTDGNITLSQTLYSESANANISIQKNLFNAEVENLNASQLDLISETVTAYFTILILKANAKIQLSNLDLTRENLQIAIQNFEAGESGKSDQLRFTSELAQNMQTLVEAVNQVDQNFIVLNQILNNPLDTEIDVEDVELSKGILEKYNYTEIITILDDPKLRETFIEFLIEEAKNNAPELKSLDYNSKAIERSLKLFGSGRFIPTVALQGQYNRTFSRSGAGSTATQGFQLIDDSYNVGVNISIPIFNQNTNNINKQIATIQQDQIQLNIENSELAIAANIRNSVLNLINELSNIELSQVSEAAAKESLELTQTSYATGAVSIIQLIDAQNNYLSAQLARTNAVYNYLIRALELERNLGYFFILNTEEDNQNFRQRFLEFSTNKN
ncbi:MAG: TolC family protein [Bacteroidota bacterium]